MKSSTKNWIIAAFIICVLAGSFYFGYRMYPKINPLPDTAYDTIYYYDTTLYEIWKYNYKDTLIATYITDTNFVNIDTGAVIKDYFTYHIYGREWKDSLLYVSLLDTITRNKSVGNVFEYKILRPQTIINNTTVNNIIKNNRYIYAGLELGINNLNYSGFNIMYAGPKMYAGVGYIPQVNTITIKGGITLFKFNNK